VRCQVIEASLSVAQHKIDRATLQLQGVAATARAGEFEWPVFAEAEPAYVSVATALAQRGDTGRAEALYNVLKRVPKHSARAREHLDAIGKWAKHVEGASSESIDRAQGTARVAWRRRMFDPSVAASEAAKAAVRTSLREAIAHRDRFRETRVLPSKELGIATQQALTFAPLWLLALHTADGAPFDVLDDLQKIEGRDLLVTSLATIAEATRAGSASADAWLALYRAFGRLASPDSEDADSVAPEDRDLYAFARFRAIQEAYRIAPTQPQIALSLARDAQEFGLADATPFILRDAIGADSPAQALSFAASLNMRALSGEAEHSHARARRMFEAITPLLSIVDKRGAQARIEPSASTMRTWMADIELRDGYIDAARALLQAAIASSPDPRALLTLARIEWRDRKRAAAIEHFKQAANAPAFVTDTVSKAEALYLAAEVSADDGDSAGAKALYAASVRIVVAARRAGEPQVLSRAERLLAKLLARFGDQKGAGRAHVRAFEAAGRMRSEVEATAADVVGTALLRGDVDAARDGLNRALSADVEPAEAVYYALWVRLIERQRNLPASPAVDRVLRGAADEPGWASHIARLGLGKTTSAALIAAAKTPVERAEALFYRGVDTQIAGDASGARAFFEQVVRGEGINLNEWLLAREWLLSERALGSGGLPADVTLP
jgi:tetratricopeptide (TPR) repeat protein